MKSRRRISSVLLVAFGGPVVHELRCFLGFGAEGEHAATAHGHLYLGSPALALTLLCGLAVGQLVVQVARGRDRAEPPRVGRVWLIAFGALLGLFALQELVEGLLASSAAPWATFGHGGWLAVPLCAGLALAIAVWLRVSAAVVARLIPRPVRRAAPGPAAGRRPRLAPGRRLASPLALARAERAPPRALPSPTA